MQIQSFDSEYNFDEIIDRENTNSLQYDLREKLFGTRNVMPMWVADMSFRTPTCVTDIIKAYADHGILGYPIRTAGFYESLCQWNELRHQWVVKPEWVSYCQGVVPALNLLVDALSNPGDGIIIQPPVYPPFVQTVRAHGRTLLENQLLQTSPGYYEIDFDDFEAKAAQSRLFILCSPHNPVGRVWTRTELTRIVEICLKHNVLIISDEIHCDLVFAPAKHIPIASLSAEAANITITCVAPSKTFNIAGLATSAVIASNIEYKKAFDRVIERYHIGMGNLFGLLAFEAAYTCGAPWLDALLPYLKSNFLFFDQSVKQSLSPLKFRMPEATFLAWVDFSGLGMSDADLHRFLIDKAQLGFNQGISFGKGGEGFMRINMAYPRQLVGEAVYRLTEAIKRL